MLSLLLVNYQVPVIRYAHHSECEATNDYRKDDTKSLPIITGKTKSK